MTSHLRIICKKFELEGVLRVWLTHFTENEANFPLGFSSLVARGEVVWERGLLNLIPRSLLFTSEK